MRSGVMPTLLLVLACVVPGARAGSFDSAPASQFREPVEIRLGSQISNPAIGDFNADGKPDIAITNTDKHGVSILLNTGAGFRPAGDFATGNYPVGIAVADLNRDGKLDLVSADDDPNQSPQRVAPQLRLGL